MHLHRQFHFIAPCGLGCVQGFVRHARFIEDSLAVDVQTLTKLVFTCTARMGRMAVRNVVAAGQLAAAMKNKARQGGLVKLRLQSEQAITLDPIVTC